MSKKMQNDQIMRTMINGRTLEQQVDYVREHGTHGLPDQLRQRILGAMDIYQDRAQAENVILFGCYLPYRLPTSMRSYLTLLDRLDIEYTFLTKEYCCGLPWVETAQPGDTAEANRTAKEFVAANMQLAREKGAKNVAYFCDWCAYLGKLYNEQGWPNQLYYPDLVVERMRERKLRLPATVVGYYEGCHSRNAAFAPGVQLDWGAYRDLLGRIEGLKVVDLRNICCVHSSEKIIAQAESLNLNTIVCSCPACHIRLRVAGRGRVQLQYFPDLLLSALN